MVTCKHCGREIVQPLDASDPDDWVHADGGQTKLHRCDPADTGTIYGYDAAPEGTPCSFVCLGYGE